jgi:hypothetical protein
LEVRLLRNAQKRGKKKLRHVRIFFCGRFIFYVADQLKMRTALVRPFLALTSRICRIALGICFVVLQDGDLVCTP